jgi:Beta-propeller repeat
MSIEHRGIAAVVPRYRWLLAAIGVVLSLASLQTGCGSSQGASSEPDAGGSGGPGDGGSFELVTDGGSGSLSVAISPASPSICAGQCVQLSATPNGGSAPYTFAWDHGLTATSGPQQVCPTATTTYSVTVTDSSGQSSGELSRANAQASASTTVTVGATCSDAGPQAAHEACSLEWTGSSPSGYGYYGWDGYGSPITTDKQSDIIVAVQLSGTLTIGATTYASVGPTDILVVKLDPDCKVLWVKQFGATNSDVWVSTIATDSASNIVMGGFVYGSVSFGQGSLATAFNQDSALVAKLDPNGNTIWAKGYPSNSIFTSNEIFDLAVDSNDSIDLIGWIAPGTDFGGGAVGGLFDTQNSYLVQLKPDGTFVFSKSAAAIGSISQLYAVATGANGSIAVDGYSSSTPATDDAGNAEWGETLASLDASGKTLWQGNVIAPDGTNESSYSSIGIDPAGDVLVLSNWGTETNDADGGVLWTGARQLNKFSPTGAHLWTNATPALSQAWNDYYGDYGYWGWGGGGVLAIDSKGTSYALGEFQGTLDLGAAGQLVSAGSTDVDLLGIDTNDHLAQSARWGGSEAEFPSGVAVDRSDDVVFFGWRGPVDDAGAPFDPTSVTVAGPYSVFVTKLAW